MLSSSKVGFTANKTIQLHGRKQCARAKAYEYKNIDLYIDRQMFRFK